MSAVERSSGLVFARKIPECSPTFSPRLVLIVIKIFCRSSVYHGAIVQVAGHCHLTVQGWLRSHTGRSGFCGGRSDIQQCSTVIYSFITNHIHVYIHSKYTVSDSVTKITPYTMMTNDVSVSVCFH
jgi:hypothetical protein